MVAPEDVVAARSVIAGRLHRTPTFTSRTLSERCGADVRLKAELFQVTGSFKPRGVLAKLESLSLEEKRGGVIAISAGNHAQAVAWAAAAEGIDALVVMWQGASEQKIAAARGYGATIDLEATGSPEAFERLAELLVETGRTLVHPFDDPVAQAGAGTVGLEILEDVPETATILVPVGGGGLVSGIAAAAAGRARVVAVEPERSPALHEAMKAGEPVPVRPTSIADGLGAPFAGVQVVAACRAYDVLSVLVSEQEIEEGFRFLYERAKLACEPAGAAAVAALLAGKIPSASGSVVAAVVSGGNVAGPTAAAILAGR